MATFAEQFRSEMKNNSGGLRLSGGQSFASMFSQDIGKRLVEDHRSMLTNERHNKQREVIQQSQEQSQQYANQSKGGFLNAVNRFLGRGVAQPVMATDSPEVIAQKQLPQPTFRQNLRNTFTKDTTQTAYDTFEQVKIDQKLNDAIETNSEVVRTLIERNKNEKDSTVKARRERSIQSLLEQSRKMQQQVGGELKNKTYKQLAGQALGTVTELTPFLGFSSVGTQGIRMGVQTGANLLGKKSFAELAKVGQRSVIKEAVQEGALFGGISGMAGAMEDNKSVKDIAKSTALGAGVGAGAGLGLSAILAKVGGKKAEEIVLAIREKKINSKEIETVFNEKGISGVELKVGNFGTQHTQFSGKPKDAIKHLLKTKEGEVPSFMSKEGLGEIDLVYGKMDNKETGDVGYGVAHIQEKHPDILERLPEIIEEGKLVKKDGSSRAFIVGNNDKVVIPLDYNKTKKQWVLTAYEEKSLDDFVVSTSSPQGGAFVTPIDADKVSSTTSTKNLAEKVGNVNVGDTESVFAKRLNEDLPEEFKIDETYDKKTFKSEIDNVSKVANENPELAMKQAMNRTEDNGNTQTATNILLSEKAKKEGDWKTVSELYNARRTANTRRGQEIAMERLSTEMNPEEKYMREVLDKRMQNVNVDEGLLKKAKGAGKKEKVLERTKERARVMSREVTQKAKLEKAESIFNDLVCK